MAPYSVSSLQFAKLGPRAGGRDATSIRTVRVRGGADYRAYLAARSVGFPGDWQLSHPRRRQLPRVSGCRLGWDSLRRPERPKQLAIIASVSSPIATRIWLLARVGFMGWPERPKRLAIIASAAAPSATRIWLLAMAGFLAAARKAEALGNYRIRGGANFHAYLAARLVGFPGGGPKDRSTWQ